MRGDGVRRSQHRYVMLRQVKAFAQRYGYAVRFLWGVTRGVSDCRHEELFAPIPGVEVRNISAGELAALSYFCQRDGGFTYHGEPFLMLRDGRIPSERFFSWDLAGSDALARSVRGPHPPLHAKACDSCRRRSMPYVRANGIRERLGIRVRVTESFTQRGKLHRTKSEIDQVLYSLYRIPWYVKVFIATDSEYVQKTLLAHFADAKVSSQTFRSHGGDRTLCSSRRQDCDENLSQRSGLPVRVPKGHQHRGIFERGPGAVEDHQGAVYRSGVHACEEDVSDQMKLL